MSGLFKRLSSRRSAGPEGSEPQQATEHGAADATTPAERAGHQSLLTDPAAPTRVLREGELTSGDPLAEPGRPPVDPLAAPAVDPNAPAPFAAPAQAAADPFAPAPLPAGAEP